MRLGSEANEPVFLIGFDSLSNPAYSDRPVLDGAILDRAVDRFYVGALT
jgi:hypothetical protein